MPPNPLAARKISAFTEADNAKLLLDTRREFVRNTMDHGQLPQLLERQTDLLHFIHTRDTSREYKVIAHPGLCTPFGSRVFIDVSGQIFQCERTEDTFPFGDVFSGIDYEKTYKVFCQDMQTLLSDTLKCQRCPFVRFCRLCFAVFLSKNGIGKEQMLKKQCRTMRNIIFRDLEFYCSMQEKNPAFWTAVFQRQDLSGEK